MNKVCISGASGYLASHIIIKLLECNYYVKGLTRNKEYFLLNYYDCLKKHVTNIEKLDNLEIIKYNHDLVDGDDNVTLINILMDCDYLIHCASPVLLQSFADEKDNVNKIITPAIRYTETILNAALFTNIKKVVFTSSTTTIYDGTQTKYSTNYWADLTHVHDAYSISKIQSEKLAWKIYNEHKKWELIVLNPGRIIGPAIYNKIPESFCSIFEALKLSKDTPVQNRVIHNYYSSYCDVRDVADIHVFSLHALTTNRYIIAFEIKEFRDYCDLLVEDEDFDEYCFIQESKEDNILFEFENSFNNYKYIPFEQSVKDSLVCLV